VWRGGEGEGEGEDVGMVTLYRTAYRCVCGGEEREREREREREGVCVSLRCAPMVATPISIVLSLRTTSIGIISTPYSRMISLLGKMLVNIQSKYDFAPKDGAAPFSGSPTTACDNVCRSLLEVANTVRTHQVRDIAVTEIADKRHSCYSSRAFLTGAGLLMYTLMWRLDLACENRI
jgi:hypothetical protein